MAKHGDKRKVQAETPALMVKRLKQLQEKLKEQMKQNRGDDDG
jgi:hypothetical protein